MPILRENEKTSHKKNYTNNIFHPTNYYNIKATYKLFQNQIAIWQQQHQDGLIQKLKCLLDHMTNLKIILQVYVSKIVPEMDLCLLELKMAMDVIAGMKCLTKGKKKHALKRYDYFIPSTSYIWGSIGSKIYPVCKKKFRVTLCTILQYLIFFFCNNLFVKSEFKGS